MCTICVLTLQCTCVSLHVLSTNALKSAALVRVTVTTCLENLIMSGNLTAVREMSGISLKVGVMSRKCRKKSEGKVA